MIFDLGSDKIIIKKANALNLGGLILLPICMGCMEQIEANISYFSNDSGALISHANGWCREAAKNNQLQYLNAL
jgi:hypothetical protein